jgi:hypothetical protein
MPRTKSTKPKISITQSRILDKNNFGDEPNPKDYDEVSNLTLIKLLNYYNYMMTRENSFSYLQDYYAKRDPKILKIISTIHPEKFDLSIGWIARMFDRGMPLSPEVVNKIETNVNYVINRYHKEKKKIVSTPDVSLDRKNERADNVIADLEGLVDSGDVGSVYQYLVNNSIPKSYIARIRDYYRPVLEELQCALGATDKALKEGYRHLSKAGLKKIIAFFTAIMDDLERYEVNRKAVRKPRKTKTISLEKKLANVQFKERFDEYQLISKKPDCILKAKEVWLFDTQYRKVIRYVANEGGLDIKGTTILNFDETKSVMKASGRKSKDIVGKILQEGKLGLRKIMDTITTVGTVPSGRINRNMLILKSVT